MRARFWASAPRRHVAECHQPNAKGSAISLSAPSHSLNRFAADAHRQSRAYARLFCQARIMLHRARAERIRREIDGRSSFGSAAHVAIVSLRQAGKPDRALAAFLAETAFATFGSAINAVVSRSPTSEKSTSQRLVERFGAGTRFCG